MEQHSLLVCATGRISGGGHPLLGHGLWPPWLSVPPAVLCSSPSGLGHVFPVQGALEVTGIRQQGACTQTPTHALALGWALRCHLNPKKLQGGSEHPWGAAALPWE